MMTVYIVMIEPKTLGGRTFVGSVYESEEDAKAEVSRIKKANSYSNAYVILRAMELKP